jgi:hypothetical protein
MGESAGATSVSAHMAMPSSWGLFHRAIIDSGAFNSWTNKSTEAASATFDQLATNLGCGHASAPVRQAFPSLMRSIWTEIYVGHPYSCHEILRVDAWAGRGTGTVHGEQGRAHPGQRERSLLR